MVLSFGSNRDVASHHTSLRGFAQQPPEGDDGRHAGAVQEEEGGQTLQTDGICVVGKIARSLSLDVQDQPAKYPVEKQGRITFADLEPQNAFGFYGAVSPSAITRDGNLRAREDDAQLAYVRRSSTHARRLSATLSHREPGPR